jgi:hypothetical protein
LVSVFGYAPKIEEKSRKGREKSLQVTCDKLEKYWKSKTYKGNLFSVIFGFSLFNYQYT